MRLLFSLIVLLASGSLCHAQVGMAGQYTKCAAPSGVGADVNGWSVFPTPTTGQIFYISTNDGNDSNNGLSSVPNPNNTGGAGAAGPWKTISGASSHVIAQANTDNGKDDWFLLKKGDVFLNQWLSGTHLSGNGKDCQHPMVFGSYDPANAGIVDPAGALNSNGVFSVASISCTGTTATVTTSTPHGWTNGNPYQLTITKELPGGFNGEWSATITGASTFTFTVVSCPSASDTTQGIVALDRPTIEPDNVSSGQNICLTTDTSTGGDLVAFVGIRCYGYLADPHNANFNPLGLNNGLWIYTTAVAHLWTLFEDMAFNTPISVIVEPGGGTPGAQFSTRYLGFRRNINTGYNVLLDGISQVSFYQNYTLYGGWDPTFSYPVSVTVDAHSGASAATITQTNASGLYYNSGGSCSTVRFAASVLPTGITNNSGGNPTTYYVVNISGNTFQLDNASCAGSSLVTASDNGTSVVVSWYGTANSFRSFPQPSIFNHSYYMTEYLGYIGVWNLDLTQNVMAFESGTSCDCGNQMNVFDNLWAQNPVSISIGKAQGIQSQSNITEHYDVVLEPSPYYRAIDLIYNPNMSYIGWGVVYGTDTGPVTVDHTIIANESAGDNRIGIGLFGSHAYASATNSASTGTTLSNDIVCNIGNAIAPYIGFPIAYKNIVAGSGYTPQSTTTVYHDPGGYGTPTQGSLHGNFGWVANATVNTGGQISAMTMMQQEGTSLSNDYKVGDVLTFPNTYVGGTGSGASMTVTAVGSGGGITSYTLNGGSGYMPFYATTATNNNNTLHPGGGVIVDLTIGPFGCSGAGCGIVGITQVNNQHPTATQGANNYNINDTLQFNEFGGTGGSVQVAQVVSDTLTNNTTQPTNCNGLGSGGGNISTDLLGDYWQTISYAYQTSVPSTFTTGSCSPTACSSGWEQGLIAAMKLQQKANWDVNITAHSINSYVRTQFGMANP